MENRTINYPVRVSPGELKKFRKLADGKHTKLAELIRQLLYRELEAIAKAEQAA